MDRLASVSHIKRSPATPKRPSNDIFDDVINSTNPHVFVGLVQVLNRVLGFLRLSTPIWFHGL